MTTFAARARAGEQLTGALMRMPAEETVEMLAVAGLDFVLLDCEHGPDDVVDLRRHLALAELHSLATIVRVGLGESGLILRALDAGATGILAPHVDTAAQAGALVEACHYPPRGQRGFATYGRAGRFGTVPPAEHKQRLLEETLVFAMPESPVSGVAAPAIFAVDGLDGYMIGVADLAASTGPQDPPAAETVAAIHTAGRAAGVIRMDIVPDRAAAHTARENGAQMTCYNLTAVMMSAFTALVE